FAEPAAAPASEAAPAPEAATAVPSSALVGGLSATEREWLFGDPQKALAQALPVSPRTLAVDREALQRQRVQRLLSRGGLEHGRGARIVEGPSGAEQEAPAPAAASEPGPATPEPLAATPE